MKRKKKLSSDKRAVYARKYYAHRKAVEASAAMEEGAKTDEQWVLPLALIQVANELVKVAIQMRKNA